MENINIEWWEILKKVLLFLYFCLYYWFAKGCYKIILDESIKPLEQKLNKTSVFIVSILMLWGNCILLTAVLTGFLYVVDINIAITSLAITIPYSTFKLLKYYYVEKE